MFEYGIADLNRDGQLKISVPAEPHPFLLRWNSNDPLRRITSSAEPAYRANALPLDRSKTSPLNQSEAADHVSALAHAAYGEVNRRADGVARRLPRPDQLESYPMMMVGIDVAQKHR